MCRTQLWGPGPVPAAVELVGTRAGTAFPARLCWWDCEVLPCCFAPTGCWPPIPLSPHILPACVCSLSLGLEEELKWPWLSQCPRLSVLFLSRRAWHTERVAGGQPLSWLPALSSVAHPHPMPCFVHLAIPWRLSQCPSSWGAWSWLRAAGVGCGAQATRYAH